MQAATHPILRTTLVQDLFPHEKRKIISVRKTDPVTVAFKAIIDHNILSVPVFDVTKQGFVAFIDVIDIMHHALTTLGESALSTPETNIESNPRFTSVTCGSIADVSKRNPFKTVDSRAPITGAIDLMVNWRVHRIPVVDQDGELLTIVTQSHLTQFVYKNLVALAPFGDKTVKELHLGLCEVFSVRSDQQAIDAFKLMSEKGVSAVAVVDGDGHLIGNVSVSDLKVIGFDGTMFSRLFVPITEFLRQSRPTGGVVSVTLKNDVTDVFRRLVDNKIHRVYVIDDDSKPIGVISLHDILKAMRGGSSSS